MGITTPTETKPAKKTGLLINRNFTLLFIGQAISLIGDQVFDITLTLWVATVITRGQSWGPLAVSATLVAGYLPYFLVGPLAGVFADRWNKRRTLLRMDAVRAVLIAVLLLVSGVVPLPFMAGLALPIAARLGIIYAVVFTTSACAQFFNPSRFALIGEVVPPERRGQASGLGQASFALALIIGPPLGAPLLFTLGIQWALIVNALSFVVSFMCISAVRPPTVPAVVKARDSVGGEFVQGLRFTFGNRVLRGVTFSALIAVLGAGSFEALFVFFVTGNLHTNPGQVGYVPAALGVGALVGAIVAGMLGDVFGPRRIYVLAVLGAGVLFFALSRQTTLGWALGVMAGIGITQAALNVADSAIILKEVPQAIMGRVIAVQTPLLMLMQLLGAALAGYLASTVLQGFHMTVLGQGVGPIDAIFAGGGALVILAGVFALVTLWGAPPAKVEAISAEEHSEAS